MFLFYFNKGKTLQTHKGHKVLLEWKAIWFIVWNGRISPVPWIRSLSGIKIASLRGLKVLSST